MPEFLPFRAIRYADPQSLQDRAAPPYDVIEDDERASLQTRDPYNSIRLILPGSYEGAASDLARWRADGVVAVDDTPTFTIYRMTYTDDDGITRTTTGVLGALGLDGGVLPHERTIPKHRDDRLRLLRATRTNTDPIWGLSLTGGLGAALAPLTAAPADVRSVDDDGVVHEAWIVREADAIARITDLVGESPVVLADGHHRYQTARNYRDEAPGTPGVNAIMTYVVELAAEEMWVQAIHRAITNLDEFSLRDALSDSFTITPLDEVRLGTLTLVDREGLWKLEPNADVAAAAAAAEPDPVGDTDAVLFEHAIASVLPEAADVRYPHGARRLASWVEKGEIDAAVLLRPVTVEQIHLAAERDLRFPQKSTFFAPKPRTGFVFRTLDD
ncbi:MAG: DUF1015 family protein [Acidimicrobiia bacterium]